MIKVTYIAIDCDGHKPIMTAETFTDLKKGLDDYYEIDKTNAECLGFFPYESKYPDEYEGYYKYKYHMIKEYIDKIKVYCVEFFPTTKK